MSGHTRGTISVRPRIRRHLSKLPGRLAVIALIGVVAALAIYPLTRVLVRTFYSNGRLSGSVVDSIVSDSNLGRTIYDTALVVVGSSVIALVVGTALAWLNERTDARFGIVTDSIPLVPFLLSEIAGVIGWVIVFSPTAGLGNAFLRNVLDPIGIHLESGPINIYSTYGIIFVYTIYQVPYVFMIMASAFSNVDSNLEEQAIVCGTSKIRTLLTITFPAVKQAFAGAWLMLLLIGFSIYSIPAILATNADLTIASVVIVNDMVASYPPKIDHAIGLSILIELVVAAVWIWQRRVTRSGTYSTVGGKGAAYRRSELGKWRWPARIFLLGYGVIAIVPPVLGLLLVSLKGFWNPSITWSQLSLRPIIQTVFNDSTTLAAFEHSLSIAVVGATVGMILAAVISILVFRWKGAASRILDGSIKLPSVFPHIVIAIGFILAFAGPPLGLGGTLSMLVLVYLVLYLPQGSVLTDSGVSQIGEDLPAAAAVTGSSSIRTFRRIYLPLLLPSIIAGWAFLFVRMVSDLTATALLAGPSNDVIGFRILTILGNGSFGQLASIGIVLTVITTIAVVLTLVASNRSARWKRS
mgnify:CR=1 FL=1